MSHAIVKTLHFWSEFVFNLAEIGNPHYYVCFNICFLLKTYFLCRVLRGLERVEGKFVFNRCRPVCPGSTADHAKYSQTELKTILKSKLCIFIITPSYRGFMSCVLLFPHIFVNVPVCPLQHCKHEALRQTSIHKQRPQWPDSRQPSQACIIAKPLSRLLSLAEGFQYSSVQVF